MAKPGTTSEMADTIAAWLRERAAIASANGFVVGLSGGIDSAVVARLCQLAMPNAVVGVLLPCHSDPQDEADARLVATQFQIPTVRVPLDEPYDTLIKLLTSALQELPADKAFSAPPDDPRARVPVANLKPRLRMTSLYFIANRLNYLVAGTGNRSELSIGYFTKCGDGGVDLLPIGELLKSQVRQLARELGVPQAVIDKPPSAGLWIGQTDESEMGFTYQELETYLTKGPEELAPAMALRIERQMRATEHKRATAPVAPIAG